MGMDAYIVKYERSGIPRNYKFFEQVLEHFRNDDGMIFIDREAWKEYKEERPHIKETVPRGKRGGDRAGQRRGWLCGVEHRLSGDNSKISNMR